MQSMYVTLNIQNLMNANIHVWILTAPDEFHDCQKTGSNSPQINLTA